MRRLALGLCGLLAAAQAVADSGQTGAPILSRTSAAAPAALGNAFVAVPGTLDGLFHNPASVAALPAPEIQATYLRGLFQDSLGGLRYGHPFKTGAAFIGVDYFDAGSIEVNLTDGTRESRTAQQDTVGILGLAFGRRSAFSAGASVKFFRTELAEESSASGFAFDGGALWKTPIRGLSIGASAANAGPSVEFEEEADPLPLTARAGFAYALEFSRFRRMRESPYGLSVLVDGVKQREEDAAVSAGLEIRRQTNSADRLGHVALRGGYVSDPEAFTVGLGVRLGGFGLDYAMNLVNDLDNTHRATLSWRFLSRGDAVATGADPQPRRRLK